MHYRRLGQSGLKISEISLGTWVTFGDQVDQKEAQKYSPRGIGDLQ
jgi:aryl-alcohol dehydrogenase-like predicted oxidoreductase